MAPDPKSGVSTNFTTLACIFTLQGVISGRYTAKPGILVLLEGYPVNEMSVQLNRLCVNASCSMTSNLFPDFYECPGLPIIIVFQVKN
jgi:hypothetical protein